jgi:hypothetical protein
MFVRIWDENTVVAAIRSEVIARNEISYYATFKRVPSLLRAGQRIFGSWRKAIEAAGFNYDDIKKYRTWSKERVIAVIQAHANEGHDLSWRYTSTELDPSLAAAALDYFDDWHKALEAAALNPELIARYKRWSLESIEEELRLHVEEEAGVEYSSIKNKHHDMIAATYRRKVSFADFRNSVVGKPRKSIKELTIINKSDKKNNENKSSVRKDWSNQLVIEAIKKRANENKSLCYKSVLNEDKSLLRAGERYFGKWSIAVEKAGYRYDSIRLRKNWDKIKVTDRIKYWKDLEENLNYSYVLQKLDADLVAAATKKTRFNSWDKALIAAGVDPAETKLYKMWTIGKVMLRLSNLREDGIELKFEVLKKYSPDLLAAVYYHIGSLPKAIKMLNQLDIQTMKVKEIVDEDALFKLKQHNINDVNYGEAASFDDSSNDVDSKPVKPLIEEKNLGNNTRQKTKNKPTERKCWNRQLVIDAINKRANENKPLCYKSILDEDKSLLSAGERYFGKWSIAVDKAGYFYDSIRMKKNWNKEKINDRIEYWKDLEDNLIYKYVSLKIEDKFAVINKTKSYSWDKALKTAGINPNETKFNKIWKFGNVMFRLDILREEGIELKTEVIKKYSPNLLAAIYYNIGSLRQAIKILDELDIPTLKNDVEKELSLMTLKSIDQ